MDNGDNGDWRSKKKKRKPSPSFSLFGEKQYIILIILSEIHQCETPLASLYYVTYGQHLYNIYPTIR